MAKERIYLCIDLKSFYASVECVERCLEPLEVNLVVADASRTEKTICLAVSPTLKSYGIPGRARLFEVVQKVREVNAERLLKAPNHKFTGESYIYEELNTHPELALSYITASPQMSLYMDYSSRIYDIYLKYIAPEDIQVYSIDEVFMDLTDYLETYRMTAKELARKMIREVCDITGITATAGIGTNMYLSKIAMDIVAKHTAPDENGARLAELDEMSYRHELWNHRPLTDFWRVGRGYTKKLEANGLYTMGDVARCSLGSKKDYYNEDFLYKLFGINAELLIDHAWGYEPCTMQDIKAYRPSTNSISTGQVLSCPYTFDKAKLIIREMTELLVLDLVDKGLVTDQVVLELGYDIECLTNPAIRSKYKGEITTDHYGREVPKHAHGTANLDRKTSSTKLIMNAVMELYDRVVDPNLLARRMSVTACRVVDSASVQDKNEPEQLSLFVDYSEEMKQKEIEKTELEREKSMQQAMLKIKKKYGKNAILKGMNLEEGATTIERNGQIGGHKA